MWLNNILSRLWPSDISTEDLPSKTTSFVAGPVPRAGAATSTERGAGFLEKDNLGTRHETFDQAATYWMQRLHKTRKAPFVMYVFENEGDARRALLELPWIHEGADSGKLISTEVLIFGYWRRKHDGKYEAVVLGDDLTHDMWERAKASFAKHRGHRKNDLEPSPDSVKSVPAPETGQVAFVREERQNGPGGVCTYRIHRGTNAASAKMFLRDHTVSRPLYYLVVETPDGNYCRDVDGIYKEGD